jgi:hypothetical protein
MRIALRTRRAAVVGEIQERAANGSDRRRKLAGERILGRPRLLLEISAGVTIPESMGHAIHAGIYRENRVIGGKQQHAVGAGLAKLRQRLQRSTGGGQRAADDHRKGR